MLEQALASVGRSGRGNVVVVCGEAGVGKTALLRSFCDQVARAQRVLWGTCDPLFAPPPFGPLFAIAESFGGELGPALAHGANPPQVALALARELRSSPPTLLVLEDLHWADEATLDVFTLLVRRAETVPALVAGTYRDDALENAHPLRRVLGELATTAAVRRLKLVPLSPDAVGQLAAPRGVDARVLYDKTGGNPFFVAEVLAGHSEEIPPTVKDAVLARAMRLSPSARELLEAAAVVPQRAERGCWKRWRAPHRRPWTSASAPACSWPRATGWSSVTSSPVSAWRARSAPRGKLSCTVKLLPPSPVVPATRLDFARLAHHAEAAGDTDAVVRFALPAAERASSMGAHREAAAQFARLLKFGAGLPLDQCADVLERRSDECYLTDQSDEAIAALRARSSAVAPSATRWGKGASLTRLGGILWCPGRAAESERAAREAIAVLEPLPASRELARAYVKLGRRSLPRWVGGGWGMGKTRPAAG